MKQKTTGADLAFMAVVYSLAGIILLIVLYPMYFVVIASFSDPLAVNTGKVFLLPAMVTLEGYKTLFETDYIMTGYWNTIKYTVAGTFVGLAVNISAAYAMSRKDLPGRKFLNLFFVFTMFFGGGLIPTYLTVRDLHLLNTFTVMVLPFSVAVYHIVIARTFFQSSLPADLWEAARIDGCGNLRYYFSCVLPLSKAVIAVIALWTAVGHWNSYFSALIYLKDQDKMPLQIILRDILVLNQSLATILKGEASLKAHRTAALIKYASIVISAAPIMCMYPLVAKHFNQGVMVGSLKG